MDLAANNDIEGFTQLIDHDPTSVDQVNDYFLSRTDVNRSIGVDQTTALHCAPSSGSSNVVDAVELLLAKGADPNMIDANGLQPVDMIFDSPKLLELQNALHKLLKPNDCPFTHLGEDARMPCPEFRNGTCRKGDLCEFAHGILECWLHPTQYRTRLCKYATSYDRELCFFAHKQEELRYVGSPSFLKPPLAPLGNRMLNWQQPNVPTLLSPGRNFQSNRLSDQSMFSPRNNMSNFNQSLLKAPYFQSSRVLESQWGSSSGEPSWADKEELDMSWVHRNNLSAFNQLQQQQNILSPFNMSLSLRESGSNSVGLWSEWGSSSGELDWAVNKEEPKLSFFLSPLEETPHVVEGAVYDDDGSSLKNELEQMGQSTFLGWTEPAGSWCGST
ncbi:zinc finger, CCCH-type, Ankyrin repeat-containing domain protein [Artemisia annua]|uniref:Zinc finger, CCCH-type, Ankyrin repeat-containing domain protein n=1 Tax=Artemisia annua TaxID=35608 RepID=A0A2U1MQ49_ARTAN|nr:zinc finger, CCCH-type, Ankyrin repeat-containing domain protein [Artemisia annua]